MLGEEPGAGDAEVGQRRAGSPQAQLEGRLREGSRRLGRVSQALPPGLKTPGLQRAGRHVPFSLPCTPAPSPLATPVPPLSLLTGTTVTTLGSYEASEGCERKKGQRWGSLERRGMQAMEGEFSQKAFFLSSQPISLPFSLPRLVPRTPSQDRALPLAHLSPLYPSGLSSTPPQGSGLEGGSGYIPLGP